jgi:peptidylprolyl isomerase
MLKFDDKELTIDPSDIQPHGLCLVVASGNLDTGNAAMRDISKATLAKLCATIGQLGPMVGDRKKMEMVRKHWKWYDPSKGDQLDATSGEVKRNGANISSMVAEPSSDGSSSSSSVTYPDDMITTTESGLKYVITKEGVGARKPLVGSVVKAHYCGWLNSFESGNKFDSSRDRGVPLEFQVGVGAVIKGWDESVLDMKKKEHRMIIVPPDIGYGDEGAGGGAIPPGATLYFHVELVSF